MLDPEFIEWLDEGTREEVYSKHRKFIKYLREHPEIYVGEQKWLDEMEQSINRSEAANNRLKWLELEKAAIEDDLLRSEQAYDENSQTKQNPLIIPLFGRLKKTDSH